MGYPHELETPELDPKMDGTIPDYPAWWARGKTPLKNRTSSIGMMKFPIYSQLGWWKQPNISGKMPKMSTKPPTSIPFHTTFGKIWVTQRMPVGPRHVFLRVWNSMTYGYYNRYSDPQGTCRARPLCVFFFWEMQPEIDTHLGDQCDCNAVWVTDSNKCLKHHSSKRLGSQNASHLTRRCNQPKKIDWHPQKLENLVNLEVKALKLLEYLEL